MKTKDQIIKDQESIGNIQTTRDKWGTLNGEGECVIKVYVEKEILYFKPKPEDKMSEFKLSDKIFTYFDGNPADPIDCEALEIKSVKEFIRLLKLNVFNELLLGAEDLGKCFKKIDKLAGDLK